MNWNHLEVLDLSYCSIDNDGWKMLVDNAHLFLNLKVLVICKYISNRRSKQNKRNTRKRFIKIQIPSIYSTV